MVQRVCPTRVDIAEGLANPRVEHEEHYFHAANTKLLDLGLQPHLLTDEVIAGILELVEHHRDRVDVRAIAPTVQWRSSASTLTTAGEHGRLLLPRGVVGTRPAVTSCGHVATQATPSRAPSITRPSDHPLLGAVAVLAALLIGGLAEVSRQSQGYDATSDRTLAAQGAVRGRAVQRHGVLRDGADEHAPVAEPAGAPDRAGQRWSSRRPTNPPAPTPPRGRPRWARWGPASPPSSPTGPNR